MGYKNVYLLKEWNIGTCFPSPKFRISSHSPVEYILLLQTKQAQKPKKLTKNNKTKLQSTQFNFKSTDVIGSTLLFTWNFNSRREGNIKCPCSASGSQEQMTFYDLWGIGLNIEKNNWGSFPTSSCYFAHVLWKRMIKHGSWQKLSLSQCSD